MDFSAVCHGMAHDICTALVASAFLEHGICMILACAMTGHVTMAMHVHAKRWHGTTWYVICQCQAGMQYLSCFGLLFHVF